VNNESIFDQSSESAVLSCFLHAQLDEQREMLSTLREDHFHLYEHKLIFQSFLRVVGKSIHADYISIKSDLDGNGTLEDAGGDKTLAEIASYCQNSQSWRRYFPQLEEARYRRSLEMLAGDMAHKARDRELKLEELKNWSETSVMRADYLIDDSEKLSIKNVVERALDNIESTMRGEPKIGIRTGLVPVDDLLMFGMRGGDMIVLAARPAVGKTSAAMQIAEHVALDAQKRVLIFSLEMTSVSLMERMIRSRARVRAADILAQSITKYQKESLANAYAEVRDSHILCDDTSGKSIGYIKAIARRAHQKEPLDLIIIDYLQLLRGDSKRSKDNRVNEVEEISGGIKELAKTLRVPVLVLAQLNRDPEKRGGRPSLSDLKGSGAIEQDSDMVIILHCDEEDAKNHSQTPTVEFIVAKNREGATGIAPMSFNKAITRFEIFSNSGREN